MPTLSTTAKPILRKTFIHILIKNDIKSANKIVTDTSLSGVDICLRAATLNFDVTR